MPKRQTYFTPGPYGQAFKDGKYYYFTDRHALVMRGWPDPRAWLKRRSHNWQPTRKFADEVICSWRFFCETPPPPPPKTPFELEDGQLCFPGIRTQEEIAYYCTYRYEKCRCELLATIPAEIRAIVGQYAVRRWHILNILARCPGAVDLHHSNPALLYAMASNWIFHKPAVTKPMREARRLVWRKQRQILEWLGFPGTKAVRRLMARIAPAELDIHTLVFLKEALHDPVCLKLLGHLEILNKEALLSISNRNLRPHVSPKLAEEISQYEPTLSGLTTDINAPNAPYRVLADTVRMAEIVQWQEVPTVFYSMKRVNEIHDLLSARMRLDVLSGSMKLPETFSPPPLPGTENIIPLTTPIEVVQEGLEQHHCVGSYMNFIIQGVYYVYRVTSPVRATLSVVLNQGKWSLSQTKGKYNQPIPFEIAGELYCELQDSRNRALQEA